MESLRRIWNPAIIISAFENHSEQPRDQTPVVAGLQILRSGFFVKQ